MIYSVFIFLLGTFATIYLYIGKKAAKDMVNGEDYFLSKRSLRFLPLMLTLFASQLGAGALLGSAEGGYNEGWITAFYPIGMGLGLVALALIFGPRLRKLGLTTVAQLFEKVYGSVILRRIVSAISIIAMFFILIGQVVGAKRFFFSLGVDSNLLFLTFWTVFILYTVLGGLKAVVKTDMIQTIFACLTLGTAIAIGQSKIEALPIIASATSSSSFLWVSALLMPLLFMAFEQDMGQKCFAAASPKTITWAGIMAASLLTITSLGAVYLGVMAKSAGITVPPGQDFLLTAVSSLTSPLLTTLVAVAVLMVILSTSDSLLCAISSNLTFDFPMMQRVPEQKKVLFSRALTLIVGLGATGFSYFFVDILPILIQSYEFSVCLVFVPAIIAMFAKKLSPKAAYLAMLLGGSSFLLSRYFILPFPRELFSLSLSSLGFIYGHFFLKEEKPLELAS